MSSSLHLWLRNDDWPERQWSEALLSAPLGEVIAALDGPAEPDELEALCNFLRQRCDERSADVLVNLLRHSDPSVRSGAAEALSYIGEARTGPAIAAAIERESDPGVLTELALAAGSVGATGAALNLIALLESETASVRGAAAASLGVMSIVVAAQPIARVRRRESDAWALRRMDEVLMLLAAAEDVPSWSGFVVFDFMERDRHIGVPHWKITTSRGTTEYRALNGDRIGMARPDIGGRPTKRPEVLDLSSAGIIGEIRTATINAHRVVTCLHYLASVESLLTAIAITDEPAILEILLPGVSWKMVGDELVGVGRCIRSSDPFLRSAAIDAVAYAWADASDHARAVIGAVLLEEAMAESRVELTRLFNAAFSMVTVPGSTDYLREQASSPDRTARRLAQRALDIRSGVGIS